MLCRSAETAGDRLDARTEENVLGIALESREPKVRRFIVSGRELFICDGFVDPAFVTKIESIVKSLRYQRKEKKPRRHAFRGSVGGYRRGSASIRPFFPSSSASRGTNVSG